MEPIDYSNIPRSPSPAIDWDQICYPGEMPIMVGGYDHPICDPALFPPCIPYLTPEANAGEMSGRSVIGPTVGRSGYIPSPYSERPARRIRNVATTEEEPWPSVKRPRGVMAGENVSGSTLEVQQQLPTRFVGDAATTGVALRPSVNNSETISGENLSESTSEFEELLEGFVGDATTAGEDPGSSVKRSTGEALLKIALEQLGMTEKEMIECDCEEWEKKIKGSSLTEDNIVRLNKKRFNGRLEIVLGKLGMTENEMVECRRKELNRKIKSTSLTANEKSMVNKKRSNVINNRSKSECRIRWFNSMATLEQEVGLLKEEKKKLEREVLWHENEIKELKRKCINLKPETDGML